MMNAADSNSLATLLHQAARAHAGKRLCFLVDPGTMTATICARQPAPVPFLTGHGDSICLGELIHTYHQWGEAIHIGIIECDGLFQFWVEQSTLD